LTAQGVASARQAFVDGQSRAAMTRYHDDALSVVTGWANSWLAPDGLAWTIEPLLASISCPVLAIQGEQDAFGTLEQVRVIRRHAPQTQLLELEGRGHVPHFEDPQAVIRASVSFIRSVTQARA
jgi:pimeloyl-ACP methyl ester carboxylesterase